MQWVTPTDIVSNIIEKTERKLSDIGAKVGRVVPANTILVTCIASIGKNAIVFEKSAFNQQINSLTPYFEKHDPYFLLTDSVNWSNTMKKAAGGLTFQIVNKTEFSEIETNIPKNKKEEQQIGILFKTVDNLLTLYQRKCDKLVDIKKSLLEKMFPKNGCNISEIRFKGFVDTWKQRKLEEVGLATGGTSIESEFKKGEKYKVISIGSYSENSTYNDQGIRAKLSDKTKKRILNKDDLTMILNDKTASGRIIGRVLIIDKSDMYVFNQRTQRIEPYRDKYDATFLYEMLNAPQIRNKIFKQSQGNTQIYVNWSTIKELKYMIPNLDEQKQLGNMFKKIDNLIILNQRKLENLKNIKKSLLEKMFV